MLRTNKFGIASAVFFFPYALFEVPSNILLKKASSFRLVPSDHLFGRNLHGKSRFSQKLSWAFGSTLFLRVTEAGLFPGANFLLSGWYRRSEFGLRASLFFSAATVSGAFGGLLSAAISKMEGVGGYSGWRWIFIIIGLATFCIGILSIWLCEDFPDTAKFLSEEEREFIVKRLQTDQKYSAAGEQFTMNSFWKAIFDWKTWIGMLIYMGVDGPLYAFSIFTPSIVKALGYSSTRANLISVPIYAFACICTVVVGFYCDRKGNRAIMNMVMISIGITGYIILAASRIPGLSYFAIYLAAAGIYPCIPNTIALTSASIEGTYKRSVVMGWIISFGNINGAATTNVYLPKDAPWYPLGHGIIIMYLAIGWISTAIYLFGLKRANKRRAKGLCDETILQDDEEILSNRQQQQSSTGSGTNDAVNALSTVAAANSTSIEQNIDPLLFQQAQEARNDQMEKERQSGIFGKFNALRRRFGEMEGGTYASGSEARAHKGDAYSKFVYSY
ncbi:hypothetical protein L7F22_019111 [Adiantum nelumboides]|nr:hypothetical protein [Adiantum nelumboides]